MFALLRFDPSLFPGLRLLTLDLLEFCADDRLLLGSCLDLPFAFGGFGLAQSLFLGLSLSRSFNSFLAQASFSLGLLLLEGFGFSLESFELFAFRLKLARLFSPLPLLVFDLGVELALGLGLDLALFQFFDFSLAPFDLLEFGFDPLLFLGLLAAYLFDGRRDRGCYWGECGRPVFASDGRSDRWRELVSIFGFRDCGKGGPVDHNQPRTETALDLKARE